MISRPAEHSRPLDEQVLVAECRAVIVARMLAVVGLAGLLISCGPQQPMRRLGGTFPPTLTVLPGLAAPWSSPGEPAVTQSGTADAPSPEVVNGQAGQWRDLLSSYLFELPRGSDGIYLPDLDLTSAAPSVEGGWIYVTWRLAQAPVSGSGMHYSVEFDTDLDGRPDVLVIGYLRAGGTWDSSGMRAHLDPDKNLGGDQPRLADLPVGRAGWIRDPARGRDDHIAGAGLVQAGPG